MITAPGDEVFARRHGVSAVSWEEFLESGPPLRSGFDAHQAVRSRRRSDEITWHAARPGLVREAMFSLTFEATYVPELDLWRNVFLDKRELWEVPTDSTSESPMRMRTRRPPGKVGNPPNIITSTECSASQLLGSLTAEFNQRTTAEQ